jgi:Icc-related predicted phosphoesterase
LANQVLVDLNDWFAEQPHDYKIVIAGNHDRSLGEEDMLGFRIFTNAIYLQNSSVEVAGLKIYGNPYTGWSFGLDRFFAFGKDRYEMSSVWRGTPKDADIWLTHTPPQGILDKVADTGFNPNEHVGDTNLLKKIREIKPKLNVFGHIHEGYGIIKEGDTTFVNCSVVNESYNLVNKPVVIDL